MAELKFDPDRRVDQKAGFAIVAWTVVFGDVREPDARRDEGSRPLEDWNTDCEIGRRRDERILVIDADLNGGSERNPLVEGVRYFEVQ